MRWSSSVFLATSSTAAAASDTLLNVPGESLGGYWHCTLRFLQDPHIEGASSHLDLISFLVISEAHIN